MYREVKSAVDFLSNMLRSGCLSVVTMDQLEVFQRTLQNLLCVHYKDHWFPEKPFRGSGYRCIRINHKMDPLVAEAGEACGLNRTRLYGLLPNELTMWIDPHEVSYRIGEDGSVGVLYTKETPSQSLPQEPAVYSPSTSPEVSPRGSPVDQGWMSTCKDQYRYIFQTGDHFNMDHLAAYVSS